MRLDVFELLSKLNSSYWFVPLVVTLGGVVLSLLLLYLDARLSLDSFGPIAAIRPSSAEGARALLSAVVGAMVTAISITFSVTIVALTVAAQHFGPRVLNNFVRHTSAQVVLGTFMATFVYAVITLGAIRGTGEEAEVPELAVTGAVALVVLSIGALIYYVHHISTTLQIGELAGTIAVDFRQSVSQVNSDHDEDAPPGEESTLIPDAPPDATSITADESGYVQRIDHDAVAEAACARDAVVWIRREPGAFVIAGTPLALVHPPKACTEDLVQTVRNACIVGRDRTLWHDPEFAVKQLVEIALRALSPGVNEPFTAITCIDRLAEGLACALATRPPRAAWPDASGRTRVYTQPQPFATLFRAAFDPIRIFAGGNPAIYARLLDAISELALIASREDDHALLRAQADVIRRAAERAVTDTEDRAYVEARYRHCLQQFSGRPVSTRR